MSKELACGKTGRPTYYVRVAQGAKNLWPHLSMNLKAREPMDHRDTASLVDD